MTGKSQSGVYIKDENYGWLPARILSSDDAKKIVSVEVTVPVPSNAGSKSGEDETDATAEEYGFTYTKETRTVQLKDYDSGSLPLQNIDESGNNIVVPDMCDLPSLHEAAILYNLKSRHESLSPYTRVGDIVIAMNPFQVR